MKPLITLEIDCPSCQASVKRADLLNKSLYSEKKAKPVSFWQALAENQQRLRCPECGVGLKIDWRSFKPLLLMIPALLLYLLLPIQWASGIFVVTGLLVATFVRYGACYIATK